MFSIGDIEIIKNINWRYMYKLIKSVYILDKLIRYF